MKTAYSIAQVEQMCGGKLYPRFDADAVVSYLMIDSRKLRQASEVLFFAIKGKRQDGHQYIASLIEQGVHNFVVSDETVIAKYATANFILVKDVVIALQKLAIAHRAKFEIPVVGITGSNGKTIVKEWLFQLLSDSFNIVRNPKSFNSQIGVPISVWQMNESHTLGIFEAGISEPDEMIRLEKVIQPTIGLFTNIGEAHAQGFLNVKHKTKEKLKLFLGVDSLVYCKDHGEINQAISEIATFNKPHEDDHKVKFFTWSAHTDADVRVTSILQQKNSSFITIEYKLQSFEVEILFIDKASIENTIHCICVMLLLGVEIPVIQERTKLLSSVAMRLEMKEAINNCTVINDAYNSDIESITIALDFLSLQQQHAKRTVILSDVYQSGRNDPDLYQFVADVLKEKKIDRFIGVGKSITRQRKSFEEAGLNEVHLFETTDELLKTISSDWFKNETILLKGARAFEFERIVKNLERKSHRTVLEINLNALAENFKVYQSLLKPETKVMAMVKAAAYGSGSAEVANVLQFNNADYLAVAYADEGVDLRKNGITLPIMVMNPEESAFDAIVNYGLEPEIYSPKLLQSFLDFLSQNNTGEVKIHLELETGMNRLGFEESDIEDLISTIRQNPTLKIASVFSHLSTSDDENMDDNTKRQIAFFDRMSKAVIDKFDYKILRHILNSNGITRFANAQFDMVRLGLGLYGIDSSAKVSHKLTPISTLKTTISQIKNIKKRGKHWVWRTYSSTKRYDHSHCSYWICRWTQ
jgi:alanine racemase